MNIKAFFEKETFTLTYVVYDEASRQAVIIDPVLDYDPKASKIKTDSVREVVSFITSSNLKPLYVLETHAHADHLSGSQALKEFFPDILVGINENIVKVQKVFKAVFNLKNLPVDGSQFDRLLKINETYEFGNLKFKVLPTPGHTPACSSFLVGANDCVFTGDALFMPDYGTGRCDFPAGSAEEMFHSVTEVLYKLPDQTRVFVGHDYLPNGRALKYETTIGIEKNENLRLNQKTTREEFVRFRQERDRQLEAPRLLLPSIQANIRAAKLPEPEDNGTRYFKIPIRMG